MQLSGERRHRQQHLKEQVRDELGSKAEMGRWASRS